MSEEEKTVDKNEGIYERSLDDENVEIVRATFYKAQEGRKDRLGIPFDKVKQAFTHYSDVVGGYYLCLSERDPKTGNIIKPAYCCSKGEAIRRWGIPVIQYATNSEGIIQAKKPEDISWELKVWMFLDDKYSTLRNMKKEWGSLTNHDLTIEGLKGKFTPIKIQPCKESVWIKVEGIKTVALPMAERLMDRIPFFFGKRKTESELKVIYGEMPNEDISSVLDGNLDDKAMDFGEVLDKLK